MTIKLGDRYAECDYCKRERLTIPTYKSEQAVLYPEGWVTLNGGDASVSQHACKRCVQKAFAKPVYWETR